MPFQRAPHFYSLTSIRALAIALCLVITMNVPCLSQGGSPLTLQARFLPQLRSGLQIDSMAKDLKNVGTRIVLKNKTDNETVQIFDLAWAFAADLRLDSTPNQIPIIVESRRYFVSLKPGETYEVTDFPLSNKEFASLSVKSGIKFPLLTVGVSYVRYTSGAEQIFDLTKDENASRSMQPPDDGGLGHVATSAACQQSQISPAVCNYKICDTVCSDPPICSQWFLVCNPSFTHCVKGSFDCEYHRCS